MVKDQQNLLEEGKLGSKNHAYLLKSKVKPNPKEHGRQDQRPEFIDQPTKGKTEELSLLTKKGRKKKTRRYRSKVGHVEKNCWKKMKDLEGKVKNLEDCASTGQSTN